MIQLEHETHADALCKNLERLRVNALSECLIVYSSIAVRISTFSFSLKLFMAAIRASRFILMNGLMTLFRKV